MALANNQRYQLADRLQADLQLTGYTVTKTLTLGTGVSVGTPQAGDPLLAVYNSAETEVALIAIDQRHFNSFNVVAELSQSAAEGLPEHITYCLMNSADSQLDSVLLSAIVKRLGTSSVKYGFVAVGSLSENNMSDANVAYELPNDSRSGASGQ